MPLLLITIKVQPRTHVFCIFSTYLSPGNLNYLRYNRQTIFSMVYDRYSILIQIQIQIYEVLFIVKLKGFYQSQKATVYMVETRGVPGEIQQKTPASRRHEAHKAFLCTHDVFTTSLFTAWSESQWLKLGNWLCFGTQNQLN